MRLPDIMEWTLDYTNACLWLRTPLAWYSPPLRRLCLGLGLGLMGSSMDSATIVAAVGFLPRYKLAKPLPEYAPHFQEANTKFEICNHLTTILEDDDNTAIDFDATVAQVSLVAVSLVIV